MGWRDDPIVKPAPKARWQDDPIVKPAPQAVDVRPEPPPDDFPEFGTLDGGGNVVRPIATPEELAPALEAVRAEEAANSPLRKLQIGAQGVGRGLADPAGALVDLTTLLLNTPEMIGDWVSDEPMTPWITDPVGGGDWIADMADSIFPDGSLIEQEDMTPQERLGYNINRFGMEALTAGSGLALKAARTPRPSRPPDTITGRVAENFQEPYRSDMSAAIRNDLGAGVGTGIGLTTAEEIDPDNPWLQLGGAVVGGVGGATATSSGDVLASFYRRLQESRADPEIPYDPVSGLDVSKREANSAAEFMQTQATDAPRAAENIRNAREGFKEAGDPVPTTGLVANDIGLAGAEQAARLKNPKSFQEADAEVFAAAEDHVTGLRDPNADVSEPKRLAAEEAAKRRNAAQQEVDTVAADQQNVTSLLRDAEQEAVDTAAKLPNPSEASRASADLDRQISEPMRTRGAISGQNFDAATEAAQPSRVSSETLVALSDTISAELGALTPEQRAGLPADFNNLIENTRPKTADIDTGVLDADGNAVTRSETTGGDVSMADIIRVRPALSKAMTAAKAQGNTPLAHSLNQYRAEVNRLMGEFMDSAAPGSEELRMAEDFWRDEYAPFFGSGRGAEYKAGVQQDKFAVKDDAGSRTRLSPSDTAAFFLDHGPESAAHLSRIVQIADDPAQAQKAVRNYLMARLASGIDGSGRLPPRRVRQFLDDHADALSPFPAVRQELDDLFDNLGGNQERQTAMRKEIDRLAEEARKARKNQTDTERDIDRSALGTLLGNNPIDAAKKVINSSNSLDEMDRMVDLVSADPAAARGWKRAVTEALIDRVTNSRKGLSTGDDGQVSGSKLTKLLDDETKDLLSKVYDEDEMAALNQAQRLLEPFDQQVRRATVGSPTAENNEMLWNSLEAVFKLRYGVLKGGGLLRSLRIAAKTLPDNTEGIKRLVERAHFDPELAEHLLLRPVAEVNTKKWNAKLNRLLGYTAVSREVSDEDPVEEDPLQPSYEEDSFESQTVGAKAWRWLKGDGEKTPEGK